MQDHAVHAAIPSLAEARSALTQLATDDAVSHLEAALCSLQGLARSVQNGERLAPSEQRQLERSLLHFRAELRDAGVLAERGLAFCQNWSIQFQPPPVYAANGAVASGAHPRPEFSIEA